MRGKWLPNSNLTEMSRSWVIRSDGGTHIQQHYVMQLLQLVREDDIYIQLFWCNSCQSEASWICALNSTVKRHHELRVQYGDLLNTTTFLSWGDLNSTLRREDPRPSTWYQNDLNDHCCHVKPVYQILPPCSRPCPRPYRRRVMAMGQVGGLHNQRLYVVQDDMHRISRRNTFIFSQYFSQFLRSHSDPALVGHARTFKSRRITAKRRHRSAVQYGSAC